MSCCLLHIHCLLVPLLENWSHLASGKTVNQCGISIIGSRSYLDQVYQLDINEVANIQMSSEIFTRRFTAALSGTEYNRVLLEISGYRASAWNKLNVTTAVRNVTYTKRVNGNLFISTMNVGEEHIAAYDGKNLYIRKIVESTKKLRIEIGYCTTAPSEGYTRLEVDVSLFMDSFGLISETIHRNSHGSFLSFYGALDAVLKWKEKHQTSRDFDLDLFFFESKTTTQLFSSEITNIIKIIIYVTSLPIVMVLLYIIWKFYGSISHQISTSPETIIYNPMADNISLQPSQETVVDTQ